MAQTTEGVTEVRFDVKSVAEKKPSVIRDKCGTHAGYMAHRYHKEITCQPCRDARADYCTQWRKNHPESKVKYKAVAMEYRVRNLEKIKEKNRRWRKENYEATTSATNDGRKWQLANPEKNKDNKRRWSAEHPEKIREYSRTRRVRKLGNGYILYTEEEVLERYGTDCHICHEPIDMEAPRRVGKPGWERGLHMEHVIPISKGGSDTIENVKPSHGLCNSKKHTE